MAVFDVCSLYERGSGAKLNYGKCDGLWLGCWNVPVHITWSSVKVKVKVLGVFLGLGNPEEDSWRQRITAVENVSHRVPNTAERLAGFGYALSTASFFPAPVESLQHNFFYCPLAASVLLWLQSIMFLATPLCPSILVGHVLFGFLADELSVVPRVFVYMLNVCKFCIWGARNNFRSRGACPSAVYESGVLGLLQPRGVISLSFKKGIALTPAIGGPSPSSM